MKQSEKYRYFNFFAHYVPTKDMKKPQDPLFYGIPEAVSEPEMGLAKAPMTALYGTFAAFFGCERPTKALYGTLICPQFAH